jgi:uncharacterized protein (TIGR03437 family)
MRPLFACAFFFSAVAAAFDASYTISTAAGSSWVGDNGPATSAILLQAEGIATDSSGNVYIADAANHRVRRLARSGVITTVAGTGVAGFSGDSGPARAAQLNSPYGLACDSRGNLYIADLGNARVRRVGPEGVIATIAGGGSIPPGLWNDGITATVVSLIAPRNLAFDSGGNLYISDFGGHRVYRMGPEGSLTAVAGTGTAGYSGDGISATRSMLSYPTGLAIDNQGALYIADSQNHLIRRVVNGVINSIGRAATPTGLALNAAGTLYIADRPSGLIVRLPAIGPATAINISARDLAFTGGAFLYAADGAVVRRISPGGSANIAAGGGNLAFGDNGAAAGARLNHPSGVAADALGNLYIADRDNHRIRRVTPDGLIATIAGTGEAGNGGDGGLAVAAQLNAPSAVGLDAAGNLYIADTGNHRVREVTAWGQIVPVVSYGLDSPVSVVADGNGYIYLADASNGKILRVAPTGVMTTVLDGLQSPYGLALDGKGNLYFTEAGGKHVRRLGPGGDVTSFGEGIWSAPRGIAANNAGDVWVADSGLQRILHIDSVGHVTAVAGDGSPGFKGDGGPALAAQFGFPWDVAAGPAGALYIADLDNNRIRRLEPAADAIGAATRVVDAVNAASLRPGPIAPGMLLALRGTGLTAADVRATEVLFNAISAPILSIDDTRLLVQVPLEIAAFDSVQIEIRSMDARLAQIPASVVAAAPALFADSSGQASAANEDGTVNSVSNPAPRGSIVTFYGTGQGVSGLPVSMSIDGLAADVLYAGPAPAYAGMLQIDARVPAGYTTPGNLSVAVTVGQASSQAGVTIAVK